MADATLRMLLLGEDRSASKALKGVGNEADRQQKSFHGFAKAAGVAFAAVTVGAVKLGVDFAKAAIEDQASARRLAVALHNTTGATKSQIAATEDWISKVEVAKGVTDNDLRASLQRLVQSTGSVSKAQKLMGLALDASAGTGKDLTVVTQAIAKAQTGNLASLSRLGIQTTKTVKNTQGLAAAQIAAKQAQDSYNKVLKDSGAHSAVASLASQKLRLAQQKLTAAQTGVTKVSLTTDQVMKNMSATFKGQAEARANSLQGRMDRLRIVFDELKETIGYKLLPIVSNFADFLLNDLGPAIGRVAGFIRDHKTALIALAGVLTTVVAIERVHAAVMAVQAAGGLLKYLQATKLVTTATKIYTAVQWALNAAIAANPVVLITAAVIALGIAVVIAYRKSETFRHIVQAAFHAVGNAAQAVFGWIKKNWPLLVGILGGPVGVAVVLIIKHFGQIKDAISSVIGAIRHGFAAAWGFLRNAAVGALNAIKAPINWVISKINWILSKIPSIKLPHFPGLNSGNGPAPPPGRFGDQGFPDSSTTNTVGGSTLGRSGNTYVITVNGALDPLAVGQQIKQVVNTHDRMTGRTPTFA